MALPVLLISIAEAGDTAFSKRKNGLGNNEDAAYHKFG